MTDETQVETTEPTAAEVQPEPEPRAQKIAQVTLGPVDSASKRHGGFGANN